MSARRLLLVSASFLFLATASHAQQTRDTDVGEVIVTASPLGGDPDRFATIVHAVKESDIQARGGGSLAEALRNVPGVAATSFAAGASRPVIRGMDANRVKVLEDGVGSADVSDIGPDHGIPIDPLSTRRIEVVRGAATLRYGSQAIGGVVNAIDDRIPLRKPEGLETEVLAAGNSNAGTGEGAIHLDGGLGDFALHADVYGRRSSDYDTPLGVQTNSFFRGKGYALGGSWFSKDEDSRAGLAVAQYASKYGIPFEDAFIQMRQTRVMSGSSFSLGDGLARKLTVDAGYADYRHDEIDPLGGPSIESTFRNREWEARAELLLGPTGALSASALGVQAGDRRFQALGGGGDYLSPTHTLTAAAFVFTEAPLGPLNVQAALRAENVRIDGTPAAGAPVRLSFTPVSASLGGSLQAGEALRLGLTFTTAARAPAVTELFARGPHDGPVTYEIGDPGLKLERANSAEASARWTLGGARVELSAWTARFDNYIHGQLTGRTCDETGACAFGGPDELKELLYVQRDAVFTGFEARADIPLTRSLSLNLLADGVRARFTGGAGDVPRIQPARIGGGLDWSSDAWDAGFTLMRVAAQDHPGALETATPGYTTLDARLSWRPAKLDGLTLSLVGRNLTDEVIRNAVALNRDLVVQPGRDVRLVIVSHF